LFVGDNNSGKSYLMALIYGLFAVSPFGSCQSRPEDLLYFDDKINDIISNNREYVFTEADYLRIERCFNNSFECCKSAFVAQIFNRDIPIGRIRIKLHPRDALSLSVCEGSAFDASAYAVKDEYLVLYAEIAEQKKPIVEWRIRSLQDSLLLMYEIFVVYLFNHDRYGHPLLLPTSRTGFMLTYKALFKHSIEKSFSAINNSKDGPAIATALTKPCIDFLSAINEISQEQYGRTIRKDIRRFIETRIIQGKIALSQTPTSDITYIPNGLNTALPLHVSSGVATETTPLLLALANPETDFLQIEEPEMCLHPGLQKEMARALIKIVNSGMPVLTSTHSDIILQHVNNAIRLKKHPNREEIMKRLGYDEDDLIAQEAVRVYQFDSHGTRSSVKEIDFDPEDGFPARTFTASLSTLLDETIQITRSEDA
jgi:hypothetical protein